MDLVSLMQNSWIIGIVGAVIGLLVVFRVVGKLLKGQAQDKQLLQTGAKGSAKVLSVQATGASVSYGGHRQPQVAMALEVHPAGGQPYQAQLVTYVSELQIPQIQPGAVLQIRYDHRNPQSLAIEAFGGTLDGAPADGQPIAAAAIPMARQSFPKGAIVGLLIGLVGVGVAVYVVMVNVGGVGLDSKPDTDTICGKAAACCEVIRKASPNAAGADTCKNFGKIGVPDAACQSAYDGFKKSAEALKVTCE